MNDERVHQLKKVSKFCKDWDDATHKHLIAKHLMTSEAMDDGVYSIESFIPLVDFVT